MTMHEQLYSYSSFSSFYANNSKGIISNFAEVLFPLSRGNVAIQRYRAALQDSSQSSSKKSKSDENKLKPKTV